MDCRLGLNRDNDGPVNSALARFIPPPKTLENIIKPSIITPIPPSHWVKERHRMILLFCSAIQSKSSPTIFSKAFIHTGLTDESITVAPVVVKPDIDSNHEYSSPRRISIKPTSPK